MDRRLKGEFHSRNATKSLVKVKSRQRIHKYSCLFARYFSIREQKSQLFILWFALILHSSQNACENIMLATFLMMTCLLG